MALIETTEFNNFIITTYNLRIKNKRALFEEISECPEILVSWTPNTGKFAYDDYLRGWTDSIKLLTTEDLYLIKCYYSANSQYYSHYNCIIKNTANFKTWLENKYPNTIVSLLMSA